MVIMISLLILVASPWFLYLNIYFKAVTLIALLFIYFIRGKPNLRILTISLFIISFLILAASVILPTNVKTRVDLEREWASNTKFSKLSPLFSNKYTESFRMGESLFFQNLDFGNYFFAGHPRERAGVEIQKLFAATLILIVFGLLKIGNNLRLLLGSFFVFAISIPVFLRDSSPNGHFLTLPIFAFLAGSGFVNLLKSHGPKGKIILAISLLILFLEGATLYAAI